MPKVDRPDQGLSSSAACSLAKSPSVQPELLLRSFIRNQESCRLFLGASLASGVLACLRYGVLAIGTETGSHRQGSW